MSLLIFINKQKRPQLACATYHHGIAKHTPCVNKLFFIGNEGGGGGVKQPTYRYMYMHSVKTQLRCCILIKFHNVCYHIYMYSKRNDC